MPPEPPAQFSTRTPMAINLLLSPILCSTCVSPDNPYLTVMVIHGFRHRIPPLVLPDPLDNGSKQVVFVAIQRSDFTDYHLSLLIAPHVVATFSRGSTGIASRKSVSPSPQNHRISFLLQIFEHFLHVFQHFGLFL